MFLYIVEDLLNVVIVVSIRFRCKWLENFVVSVVVEINVVDGVVLFVCGVVVK